MVRRIFIIGFLLFITLSAHASDFGVSYSNILIGKDPDDTNGYRVGVNYQPKSFNWDNLNIYFDAGYTHLWIEHHIPYRSISIYSLAPYFRYYIKKTHEFSPFVEASIGLAYMTKTHFGCRNLGIHYTFQDILSLGIVYGKEQRFYTMLSAIHYSNGSMSSHNSGITAPLMFTLGYRF